MFSSVFDEAHFVRRHEAQGFVEEPAFGSCVQHEAVERLGVGDIFMKSGNNGSVNPAVDTVAVGGSVTWTWTNTGNVPHGIQSLGSPSFPTGTVLTGDGKTYRVTFNTAGTYQYDCLVHGTMMPGTIVVR